MKRLRVLHDGRAQWGVMTGDDHVVRLSSGATVPFADAKLLPPVMPGATTLALALNFADHSAELGFKAPEKPLAFLKGPSTFGAHGGVAPLPADAEQMHPEVELVAVIGRPARKVTPRLALDHVGGYTVVCDYAIREYLENYYRPNFRVKSRDGCTPIGPWIVDARDVGDPQALRLSTAVNDVTVQHGATADMVFSVADLIAYFSDFMTLQPGDMILTGTPHGVHFVRDGDRVACEVEKVGRLEHEVRAS